MSPVTLSPQALTYIYVTISIAFGILMAHIIEFPMLQLRDSLFPRTGSFGAPNRTEGVESTEPTLTEAALT